MEGFNQEKDLIAELAVKKDIVNQEEGHLTVDVFKDGSDVIIQSTIAGADPKDIDISITSDMVTIRGQRHNEHKTRSGDYFHQELYWGSFSRSIILPADVDPDKSKASFKNGILSIRMPLVDKSGSRK